MIRHLYNSGADINYKDEEGTTLFLHSCEKGRLDIINFLIKKLKMMKMKIMKIKKIIIK